MEKQKNPFSQKFCTMIAFYLAVASIFPPLKGLPGYTLSCLAAMLVWILCAALAKPSFFTIFTKSPLHKQLILFFLVYTSLVPYLFGNDVIGNRYMTYAQVLIFYFIYQYNRAYGYNNSNKAIIKWSLPFIIYTSIVTLYGLINNPYLSRSIKSSGEYSTDLQSQGIGGYEFIYFLVFVGIMLMFVVMNKRVLNFRNKLAVHSLLALFVLTVVYSNYFTALIMLIVSLVMLIGMRKSGVMSKLFTGIIGVVFLVQGKEIFTGITNWLVTNLNSGRTVERVIALQADVLGYGSNESLLAGRLPTLEVSWDAFLRHPFFGMILKPIESDGGFLTGFGQHSQFLDTFALYGVFIGLLNIYIVVQPFLNRMKGKSSFNLAMLASVLMLFVMNNVTPSIGFAIFFIYPVLHDWQVDHIRAKEQIPILKQKTVSHTTIPQH